MNNINLIELDNEAAYTKGKAIRNASDMPKEIVTKEMNKEWLERLSDKHWATHYTGVLEQEVDPNLLPYYKKALELRDKILTFGGEQVCMPFLDKDTDLIKDRGQLWYGDRSIMQLGYQSQCHHNSCVIWTESRHDEKKDIRIATGYALSNDGMWRSHSWCVLVEEESNTIIETTEERVAYFGFVLSDVEAVMFSIQELS